MRVKPYAMRSPPLTARHTALWAPGGCMSTSGCSCRYRSSLRTWSGGPGGISCTGQYRYRVSSQHKSFPKSHATRLTPSPTVAIGVPSAVTDGQVRKTNPTPPPHVEPLPSSTGTGLCAAAITGLLATGRAPIRCSGTDGRGPTRPHADVSEHALPHSDACLRILTHDGHLIRPEISKRLETSRTPTRSPGSGTTRTRAGQGCHIHHRRDQRSSWSPDPCPRHTQRRWLERQDPSWAVWRAH